MRWHRETYTLPAFWRTTCQQTLLHKLLQSVSRGFRYMHAIPLISISIHAQSFVYMAIEHGIQHKHSTHPHQEMGSSSFTR
ncbi:hypothetical protein FKM82_006383 [Ascaphus truei]